MTFEDGFMARRVVFVPGPEFGMIRHKTKFAAFDQQPMKLLDRLVLKDPPLVVT